MRPLLSIITVTYNNRTGLEKTIVSVVNQSWRDFEFIIVDGGSTDGSSELIEQYKSSISKVISEKDKGIYDAQNKGIASSKGQYLLFLNAGDTFHNATVVFNFVNFIGNQENRVVYGNSKLLMKEAVSQVQEPPAQLDKLFFFKYTLNHQACFIARSLFDELGNYNIAYKICADFDFLLKVFCLKPDSYLYFNMVICDYDYSGLSSLNENYDRVLSEKHSILKKNLSSQEYRQLKKVALTDVPLKYRVLARIYKLPLVGRSIKQLMIMLHKGGK